MSTKDEYAASYKVLITCIAARIPVVLWGPPGQGKTSVIKQIAADRPSSLCLPPRIIDNHVREMIVQPVNCVRIAPLTHKCITIDGACIEFLNPLAIVVFLFDDSHGGWGHVQGSDLILLDFLPNYTRVGSDWFSFKEN